MKASSLVLTVLLILSSTSPILRADDATAPTNLPTAQDQSTDAADQKVTQDVRQALVKDKDLSVEAQNIVVVTTKEHVVFLRGNVASKAERHKVVSLAKSSSGSDEVKAHLMINK